MKTLSPKQQQIYDYIVSFSGLHGYPPSVREIGEYVGLKSPSTVHFHLKGLEAAGLITKAEGKTRAITISGPHPGAPEPAGEEPDQVPVVGSVAAGAPTVKTLRRRDGHTWLMPENPDYEPIDGDGCTILGKVVAVVRRY